MTTSNIALQYISLIWLISDFLSSWRERSICLKITREAAAICSSHLRNPQGGESCPIRLSSSSARVYSQEGRYAVRTERIKTRRKETSPITPTRINNGLQGSLATRVATFAMKYRCTVYCCISFGRLDEDRDYVLGLQPRRLICGDINGSAFAQQATCG